MAKSTGKSLSERRKSDMQIRLQQAFLGRSLSDIASELGENYSSFWNWSTGRTRIPNDVLAKIARRGISVNWVLTGEGPVMAGPNLPSLEQSLELKIKEVLRTELLNETPELYERTPAKPKKLIRDMIREIVREEIQATAEVQDLGTIDEYLADELKKSDNPSHVLTKWYERDGLAADVDFSTLSFSGWDDKTLEEKVQELKATRRNIDKMQEFRKNVPPKDSQ